MSEKVRGSHPAKARYKALAKDVVNKQRKLDKYIAFLKKKILQLTTRNKKTDRIEKELNYALGKEPRPSFLTGAQARLLGIRKAKWSHD